MEPPEPPSPEVVADVATDPHLREAIVRAVRAAYVAEGQPLDPIRVCLTDDARVRELNHCFRSLDAPTDVLTFVDEDGVDLAISLDTAQLQAEMRGVALADEVGMLAIHGALHALGYDDETDAGRAEMVRRMDDIATIAGLASDSDWWSRHYAEGRLA